MNVLITHKTAQSKCIQTCFFSKQDFSLQLQLNNHVIFRLYHINTRLVLWNLFISSYIKPGRSKNRLLFFPLLLLVQLKPDIILCEKLNYKHCCASAGRNLSSIIGAQRGFLSWFISEKCWFFMRKSLQRGSLSFLQQTQGLCFPAARRLKRHRFSDGLLLASHSVISTGKQCFITLITTLGPCFNMITQSWDVPDFAAL